jgi:hypothetical protein
MAASFADSLGLTAHPTTRKQIASVAPEKRKVIREKTALVLQRKPVTRFGNEGFMPDRAAKLAGRRRASA